MGVTISKCLNSYDFLHPDQKQWRVGINLGAEHKAPKQQIGETWDEDDEPDTDGQPPSVVSRLIREKVESYLISTSRPERLEMLDWIDEHSELLDHEWARGEIDQTKERVSKLVDRIEELRGFLIEEES